MLKGKCVALNEREILNNQWKQWHQPKWQRRWFHVPVPPLNTLKKWTEMARINWKHWEPDKGFKATKEMLIKKRQLWNDRKALWQFPVTSPHSVPSSVTVLKIITHAPCWGPCPWLQHDQSRPYSQRTVFISTCLGATCGLTWDTQDSQGRKVSSEKAFLECTLRQMDTHCHHCRVKSLHLRQTADMRGRKSWEENFSGKPGHWKALAYMRNLDSHTQGYDSQEKT